MKRPARLVVWLCASAGLLLLAVANGHLVYVAATSQPDCVAHARVGEAGKTAPAARSACTPR